RTRQTARRERQVRGVLPARGLHVPDDQVRIVRTLQTAQGERQVRGVLPARSQTESETMKSHKLADTYPIEPRVVEAIAADMRANGFSAEHPIIVDKRTGLVVDGRTRQAAAEAAGVDPVVVMKSFADDVEIGDYIRRANDNRRGSMSNYQRMVQAINW